MVRLISKVQHNNFEIGEFVEENERNYDETISLIEMFPWEEERIKLVVTLTNPSVTIHGRGNDFFKLALFYNEKFVLHYFNGEDVLFTKSFTNIRDSYPYIANFFEEGVFNTKDFKKENTWMQHNRQHFVTNDFHYVVTRRKARRFFLYTTGWNLVVSIVLSTIFLFPKIHLSIAGLLVLLLVAFFISGINLILFFSYHFYLKNKILIMSKGNDVFYFGDINNPMRYDKSQIIEAILIGWRQTNSRAPWLEFAIIRLVMKDGLDIEIPNLLVNEFAMKNKLTGIPQSQQNRIPFLWS